MAWVVSGTTLIRFVSFSDLPLKSVTDWQYRSSDGSLSDAPQLYFKDHGSLSDATKLYMTNHGE